MHKRMNLVEAFMATLFLVVATCTVGLTDTACAAPSISATSGTWTGGQPVTITGAGFGTKTQAAPQVWDNFSGGTNGQAINGHSPLVGTAWTGVTNTGGNQPVYSNAQHRSSPLAAYFNFDSKTYASRIDTGSNVESVFLSLWMWVKAQGSGWSPNFKPWYLGLIGGSAQSWIGDANDGTGMHLNFSDSAMSPYTVIPSGMPLSSYSGQWIRMDTYAVAGSGTGGKAFWDVYVAGAPVHVVVNNNAIATTATASSWDTIDIGAYNDEGDPMSVYMTDIYVDTTPQRIEVCDASTWAGRSHCEIQVPTAWANGSLSVKVNQGTFANSNQAYVYVVDATNTANSQGYPITFGSASTSSLAAPSGLWLIQ